MPCRDWPEERVVSYEDTRKVDKLTRMLCFVMSRLDPTRASILLHDNKELADWWKTHQEQDRRRLAYEAEQKRREDLKKSAKSKLSPEERRALGI